MSFVVTKMAIGVCSEILSPNEKYILIVLSVFSRDDGSSIFPSINNLEKLTGFGRRTIERGIEKLRDKNFLIKISEYDRKLNKNSVYKINLEILKNSSIITP